MGDHSDHGRGQHGEWRIAAATFDVSCQEVLRCLPDLTHGLLQGLPQTSAWGQHQGRGKGQPGPCSKEGRRRRSQLWNCWTAVGLVRPRWLSWHTGQEQANYSKHSYNETLLSIISCLSVAQHVDDQMRSPVSSNFLHARNSSYSSRQIDGPDQVDHEQESHRSHDLVLHFRYLGEVFRWASKSTPNTCSTANRATWISLAPLDQLPNRPGQRAPCTEWLWTKENWPKLR